MTVWFITGASRGFGLEITREALSRGDSVVATARDPRAVLDAIPDADDRLLAVALDVSDPAQISAAVDAAIARFGRIDALINNAGRGLVGSVEETSDAEARAIFDVNVFGLLAITRAVSPTCGPSGRAWWSICRRSEGSSPGRVGACTRRRSSPSRPCPRR